MKKSNPIGIKVHRAELRKGKIIIVIEPDLLTRQEFAVNPFYDEGAAKNMLQKASINIALNEVKGEITIDSVGYNGYHLTTGFTQLSSPHSYFLDKKSCAINEIETTEIKYISDESRMNKLLDMWDKEPEIKAKLEALIQSRKDEFKKTEIKKAKLKYEKARRRLDKLLFDL